MAGKWFTLLFLTGCIGLVVYAAWHQSSTTREIRRLWTPQGARLIQSADEVRWWPAKEPSAVAADELGDRLSAAPGLIHLRATLLDDVYFDWSTRRPLLPSAPAESSNEGELQPEQGDSIRLRFGTPPAAVDLVIHLHSGRVDSLKTRTSVCLIPSSRRAVEAYFRLLVEGATTTDEG